MTGAAKTGAAAPGAAAGWLWAALLRAGVGAAGWWAVVEGDTSVLGYGLVVVPLAVATSLLLHRPQPRPRPGRSDTGAGAWVGVLPRAGAVLVLVGWLLRTSVVGGVDVARRALARTPDVDPVWFDHPWSTADRTHQVVLTCLMNLMPGSLSVQLQPDHLEVHVLHHELGVREQLQHLDRLVGRALGTAPEPDRGA